MEILQFLISFFMKEYGGDKIMPILNCFKENSYDVKRTLQNLKPEMLAPLLQSIMQKGQKVSPHDDCGGYGTKPIDWVADKRIVNCLNGYFNA